MSRESVLFSFRVSVCRPSSTANSASVAGRQKAGMGCLEPNNTVDRGPNGIQVQHRASPRQFQLRSEPGITRLLYATRGDDREGQDAAACEANDRATALFTEALILNPNLAAGYVALADQLSDSANKAGALQVVKNGLQRVPDSRPLQRRYLMLGGKEPFPGATPTKQGGEPEPAKQ